jgi:hypothetical protein
LNDDSDDGNDGDDIGGAMTPLATDQGGHEQALSPFTADRFTHTTHNADHGMLTSARMPSGRNSVPTDSFSSSTEWIDDHPLPGPYTYNIPDV